MSYRIVFVREIPELTGDSEPVRFLAEIVWYDVYESAIYVQDPISKKGKRKRPIPLVKVDISEFRKEQVSGFKSTVPFQCVSGGYLTILGKTYITEKEKNDKTDEEEEEENTYSKIGIKAFYINNAKGTDIETYARAIEARRKYVS